MNLSTNAFPLGKVFGQELQRLQVQQQTIFQFKKGSQDKYPDFLYFCYFFRKQQFNIYY